MHACLCRDAQYTGRSSTREPGFVLRNDPASQLPDSFDGFQERVRQERQAQKQVQLVACEQQWIFLVLVITCYLLAKMDLAGKNN
jgi:hypothetical protein